MNMIASAAIAELTVRGYSRMMTVDGLFGAGDSIGVTAHKFPLGAFDG